MYCVGFRAQLYFFCGKNCNELKEVPSWSLRLPPIGMIIVLIVGDHHVGEYRNHEVGGVVAQ